MMEKKFADMAPEEFIADIRRRSPAMAMLQDMIEGKTSFPPPPSGLPSPLSPEFHDVENEEWTIPGEVSAAISTNRVELLVPLRNRVEGGESLDEGEARGVFTLLETFYKRNVQQPILFELLEALEPLEEQLTTGAPTVETSLALLDKLQMILMTIDHRRDEVNEGTIPLDQIVDGHSRAAAI